MSSSSIKDAIVDARINQVLAMRTDSVAMLEALDAISEFYITNNAEARKLLRQDLEHQNILLSQKYLSEFSRIFHQIEIVEDQSKDIQIACGELANKVKDADENMKSFMEKASQLENKRNFFKAQSCEIAAFLTKFQLTNTEVNILYNSNIDRYDEAREFFEAIERLKKAFKDCREMVQKHHHSVGFELLEVLGQHQDAAYQHLFEWVKQKCDALAETGSAEDFDTNIKLQMAIRCLRKLPIYFSQCQDLLVNTRRTQLVQKFVIALTQGESASSTSSITTTSNQTRISGRAIDLLAHDPTRYVSGMLAWMHQTIASELEFLESIFNSTDDDEAMIGLTTSELLARCVQGLGKPLRVRIMQTMETRSNLEILYSFTDLLAFYKDTFQQIISIENAIHSAVKGCLLECKRMFSNALNKQCQTLLDSPISYPMDLKASHVVRECALQMKEILQVFANALSTLPQDKDDVCHIETVLKILIQALLQSCRVGSQSLAASEMATFMLNNISVIKHETLEAIKKSKKVEDFASTASWNELLESEANTWLEVVIQEETMRTLRRSEMDKLIEMIGVVPSGVKAVDQVGLGQDRVGTVMRAFYASLFSMVAPPFDRLQDPSLRELLRMKTAQLVSSYHAKVHKFISDPSNGYKDVSGMLSHSPHEVSVLLGCDTSELDK